MKVILIGRNEDHPFAINHPSVSRNHAEIREKDGVLTLTDLNSTNGTFLVDNTNQKIKVKRAMVTPDQVIFIGETGPHKVADIVMSAHPKTQMVDIKHMTSADHVLLEGAGNSMVKTPSGEKKRCDRCGSVMMKEAGTCPFCGKMQR